MTWRGALLPWALLCGCGGAPVPHAVPPPLSAAVDTALRTAALLGARREIDRTTGGRALAVGTYLDTMVGPSPAGLRPPQAHPRDWLEAMVASRRVDGLFGVPTARDQLPREAFAIEVGAPFRGAGDTLQVLYAWCLRPFPTERGSAGATNSWRDLFIPGDTGWTRVAHRPEQLAFACTP